MRYRRLDADRDMTFGQGLLNFLIDSREAVAQAVLTRLLLLRGEWFVDLTEGTPYATEVLGYHTRGTRDAAIRARILGTPGVVTITAYSSTLIDRAFSVTATLDTIFGQTTVSQAL